MAHFAAEDEKECLFLIRELLSFIPQNNMEDPPIVITSYSIHYTKLYEFTAPAPRWYILEKGIVARNPKARKRCVHPSPRWSDSRFESGTP